MDSGPMFPAMCHQFAREIGKNTLIPSPTLHESKRLLPLNVVTMREKKNKIRANKIEYSTCIYSLTDLLIDKHVLESQVHESPFCTYDRTITCALSGKIGAGLNGYLAAKISASNKVAITCKLGKLIERSIEGSSLASILDNRKLNMDHSFIKQIKDTKIVLCVVQSVITTLDKAEIQCTNKTEGNIEVSEKVEAIIDAGIRADMSSARNMVIETGTNLAYQVMELKVDLKSGEIIPMTYKGQRGGFFRKELGFKVNKACAPIDIEACSSIEDEEVEESNLQSSVESLHETSGGSSPIDYEYNVGTTLQDLQDILQPLRDCKEADGQPIKSSLLDLMTCYSDVVAISKILSKAEDECLNEEKDNLDKQFINKDTAWSILKFVGVQTEEGRVLYEKEATPILIAVVYMIDAILELESDDFDIIYRCDEPQLKTLSKIFESAVASSKTISIDVDMSSVLKEPVSSFLTRLKFTVCNDSIQPPKAKICIVECIFCVLYCLL